MSKSTFFWVVCLLVGGIWLTAVPQPVAAHAYLQRSEPADGARLSTPPEQVHLWFDEPIAPQFSSVQVFDNQSHRVPIHTIHTNPDDPYQLTFSFGQALPEGVYTVLWRALSEADGHLSYGMLIFGVGETIDLNTAATLTNETPPPAVGEVLLRWLNLLTLGGMVGSVMMAHLVIRPLRAPQEIAPTLQQVQTRLVRAAFWFAAAAFLVGVGLLAWQIRLLQATLPQSVGWASVAWQVIGRTRWGLLWDARQVMLLLTLFSLHQLRPFPLIHLPGRLKAAWGIAALFLLTSIVLQSSMGHAAAIAQTTWLSVSMDALHLLGATIWIGGLLALAITLLPLLSRTQRTSVPQLIQASWGPFGGVAVFAVLLLIATGLYSTGQQVASIDALISTLYGRTLLGKVGLMLLVGLFGLLNASLLHPHWQLPLIGWLKRPFGRSLSRRHLPRLIVIELALGTAVLLLTGVITAASAPRGIEYTVAAGDAPNALSEIDGDMLITLFAKPNHPGQNVFTIFAASSRRPAPAEVQRVLLRFTYLEQEMGKVTAEAEAVEPGRYLVTGNYFSLPGRWQVDIAVRRPGMEDATASFEWVVLPANAQPEILSKQPLQRPLTAVGITLLLCTVSFAGYQSLTSNRPKRPSRSGAETWIAQLFGFDTPTSAQSIEQDEVPHEVSSPQTE